MTHQVPKLPSLPDFDGLNQIKDEQIRVILTKLIKYVEDLKASAERELA